MGMEEKLPSPPNQERMTGLPLKNWQRIVVVVILSTVIMACDSEKRPTPTPTEPPWPAETAPQSCDKMVGADFLIRARLGFCRCPKTLEEWGRAFREIFDTGVCVYGPDGRLETY